jgi:hypothetical protein
LSHLLCFLLVALSCCPRPASAACLYNPTPSLNMCKNVALYTCSLSDCESSLTTVSLSTQHVWGTLPASLGSMSQLLRLSLPGNSLTGSLPPSVGSMAALSFLELNQNALLGQLPPSLSKLANLVKLNLDDNDITGLLSLGGLDQVTTLRYLSLNQNELEGTLPHVLGSLGLGVVFGAGGGGSNSGGQLTQLWLDDNSIVGSIPPSLGSLRLLQKLGLADNRLTGSLPSSLGSLAVLTQLTLEGNSFVGTVGVVSWWGGVGWGGVGWGRVGGWGVAARPMTSSSLPAIVILTRCLPSRRHRPGVTAVAVHTPLSEVMSSPSDTPPSAWASTMPRASLPACPPALTMSLAAWMPTSVFQC